MAKSTVLNWRLESFRLTAFGPYSVGNVSEDAFENTLQVTPERTEVRRAEGLRVDTAISDGKRFTLQLMPGRLDWSITPTELASLGDGEIGEAADVRQMIDQFRGWLEQLEYVNRIALGAILKVHCAGKEDSYTVLQEKLHYVKLDPNSSEFNYRINRPRNITVGGIEGLLINRISTWNAIVIQQMFQPIPVEGIARTEIKQLGHWARCELDLSTDATRTSPLTRDERWPILQLLSDFSVEIANEGDRP